MKQLLLCIAAGFATLVAGLSVSYAGRFPASAFADKRPSAVEKIETVEKVETVEAVKDEPLASIKPKVFSYDDVIYPKYFSADRETAEIETQPVEEEEKTFYGGDYYIIGGAPEGFEDCEWMTVTMMSFENSPEENRGFVSIPPTGSVSAGRESEPLKFMRTGIFNETIAFVTEKRNGISYQFVGKLIDGEEVRLDDYTDTAVIKGTLTKLKNGKKVAEREVKFGLYEACRH